jgi:hypothetical protein
VPIYRYINVAQYHRIDLGKPFEATEVAREVDDSTLELRSTAIVDSVTVRIFLTPERRVYAFAFTYRPPESFDSLVARYTGRLGPPSRMARAPAAPETAIWEDDSTRFEIRHDSSAMVRPLQSRITDLRPARRGA